MKKHTEKKREIQIKKPEPTNNDNWSRTNIKIQILKWEKTDKYIPKKREKKREALTNECEMKQIVFISWIFFCSFSGCCKKLTFI